MHWTRFFGLLPFMVFGLFLIVIIGAFFAAIWAVVYLFPWLIPVGAVIAFLIVFRKGRWA